MNMTPIIGGLLSIFILLNISNNYNRLYKLSEAIESFAGTNNFSINDTIQNFSDAEKVKFLSELVYYQYMVKAGNIPKSINLHLWVLYFLLIASVSAPFIIDKIMKMDKKIKRK